MMQPELEQPRRGRTLNGEVYDQIRSDILTGKLQPGERLLPGLLCERFGVSLSVVREALTRVAEYGLARAEPQLGFRVISLDAKDLQDLTDARVVIETWALRQSIIKAGMEWETGVVASHHVLTNTPGPESTGLHSVSEAWSAAHSLFHGCLAAGCANPRMLAFRLSLFEASEIYRRWATPAAAAVHRDVVAEHRAIMEAALARDADLACELLTQHLRMTTWTLLRDKGDAARAEQTSAEQTSGKQTSGKQTSGKQTSGTQTSGKQTSGKQPGAGQARAGATAVGIAADVAAAKRISRAQQSSGEKGSGSVTSDRTRATSRRAKAPK